MTQAEAGFNIQGAVRVLLDELLVTLGSLGHVLQVLVTLSDQQFHLDSLFRLGTNFQRLVVKLQGFVVVGFLLFLGRLEVSVSELQVDVGNLLLPLGGEQVLGLGPIDQLGPAEITLASQSHCLAETCSAAPGTFGKLLQQGIEDAHGLVVFLLQVQGAGFEICEVILGSVFFRQFPVNGLDGGRIVAVLHQLANLPFYQGGIQRDLLGRWRFLGGFRQNEPLGSETGQCEKGKKCRITDGFHQNSSCLGGRRPASCRLEDGFSVSRWEL